MLMGGLLNSISSRDLELIGTRFVLHANRSEPSLPTQMGRFAPKSNPILIRTVDNAV